ncbi:hypothetical protein ciss_07050 [Carboxydothermus islandicus]|uniref:Uncharacterized protein n=1 Tax=Carboxydothermus islandicus TaxID=661089 RepID=A0A1L8D0T5_9THEO|nr:hypothetical protein [Carboxydothermus islandicus]GAV24772.1 hypothetical protein ciss_07050 [Carboxydothermus islandicus]
MWISRNGEMFNLDNVVKISSEIDEYNENFIATVYFVTTAGEEIVFARRAFPNKYHADRYVINVLEIVKAYLKAADIKIDIKEAV